jgi:hypothetical protein
MPSPDGCFVEVWDRPSFTGTADYINGPRVYANLRDMPGGHLWNNRIGSVKTGPAATATVWSDENLRGQTMQLRSDTAYSSLPETLSGKINSLEISCASGVPHA